MTEKSHPRFDALDRAIAILRILEDSSQPLSMTEIAGQAGLSQATTLRYLASLGSHGFVERDRDGTYGLGIALFSLGQKSLRRKDLRVVARPFLEELHRTFNETVNLVVRSGDELVVIDAIEGTQALRQGSALGIINPWHASSLGKAILARLSRVEVDGILSRLDFTRFTEKTLVSPSAVIAELPRISERRYAIDDEESAPGLRCVGAAIVDDGGRPISAISISGPATRIQSEALTAIAGAIVGAARQVSTAIGFLGPY